MIAVFAHTDSVGFPDGVFLFEDEQQATAWMLEKIREAEFPNYPGETEEDLERFQESLQLHEWFDIMEVTDLRTIAKPSIGS